jgi:predicted nucleic acid-binding protein
MRRIILLDAGPLGLIVHPRANPEAQACSAWLELLLQHDADVRIPEIADYEVRRGLPRVRATASIDRLNALRAALRYVPLRTPAMLRAAQYWADLRHQGFKTADDRALDGDVILAAQAADIGARADLPVVVATDNVKHLEHLCDARQWRAIGPESPPDSVRS